MSRSSCNKNAGAVKGKLLLGAAVAALCAMTLFVVCGGDDKNSPSGPTTYTLAASASPSNSGSVSRNPDKATYNAGEVVTVTATAFSGYTFLNWAGAVANPTAATTTVTVNGNMAVTANFSSTTGGNDPCAGGPTAACCAVNSSYPGCGTGTGAKYCRWDGDPTNCWEIGTQWSDENTATEAACIAAYGEVVTNCNTASTLQYCDWGAGGCYAITNPNSPADPPNSHLTNLQNCQNNGRVVPNCDNWTPPTTVRYCYWGVGNCQSFDPTAAHSNNGVPSGLTMLEACTNFGQLVPENQTCSTFTPNTVVYCDWGGGECWPQHDGGDNCRATYGTVVSSCP
ncbi:MAG: hypothetical protein FWB94_01340 [Chitinispirillia bacterium]|nr:hypothetical protein [Chitinispirillia bacterium]